MTRRHFLGSLAVAAQTAKKPNIVFILADDYGWTDTAYNGSKFYQTPHLDRLAKAGMVFTDGYSASPVCSPTRSAIMTGKYPARLHITSHIQGASNRLHFTKVLQPNARLALPLEEVTIAELLGKNGYRTACIGKWHLGTKGFLPSDQGFHVSLAGDEAGSTSSFFYPKWKTKVNLEGKEGDYLTDRLTTLAVEFVRENRDRPFFLYLPHFAVHTPIEGKPEKVRKFEAKVDPSNPQNYAEYAAMVESLDESVGRVLDVLDELKLTDSTLVIFTSDNGGVVSKEWKNRPVTSNLPLRSGKGHLYEGGIRVPTIARLPGVTKAGSVCRCPILSVDYAPTIAELAGVPMAGVDGVSFRKLLAGAQRLDREDIFFHYPHYSPQLGRPAAAIRRGDYKLILFFEDSRVELYNLAKDIGETKDLSGTDRKRATAMRTRLEAWLKETGAQIPQPNPAYDPAREREAGKPTGPVTAK